MPQNPRPTEIVCDWCHKPFVVKQSEANRGRRFCSWDCRIAYANDTKETVKCKHCGKEFTVQKSKKQQYCSQGCSTTARNLTDKNPSFHRDISGKKNPMYGKPGCKGERNGMYGKRKEQVPGYKGGRKVRKDGYVLVIAPDDHPCREGETKHAVYMLEHRLVMEQHLGRYLDDAEIVHHLDGNPSNNELQNLQLYKSQSEHVLTAHPDFGYHNQKPTPDAEQLELLLP